MKKSKQEINAKSTTPFSRELFKDESFKSVIKWFAIVKVIVILAAVAGLLIPETMTEKEHILDNKFLNLFAQYDASAYVDIATNGYNSAHQNGAGNYAYYPMYPLLIKLFSFIFGIGWSAFLVANILSFLAIAVLYVFLKDEYNSDIAKKACFFLTFFPLSYFFTMMYTESLFLFLIVLMFYYAKRENWVLVGLLGFFASITRMFGLIMIFPMAYMYFKSKSFKIKQIRWDVLWLALIGVSYVLFQLYLYLKTGNLFAQFDTFNSPIYSFKPDIPGHSILVLLSDVQNYTRIEHYFYFAFNIILFLLAVVAVYFSFGLGLEYGLFMLFYFFLATGHTTVNANTRYYMLMFPAYILLAKIKSKYMNKKAFHVLITLGLLLCIAFTIRHVNKNFNVAEVARYIFSLLGF